MTKTITKFCVETSGAEGTKFIQMVQVTFTDMAAMPVDSSNI